MSLSAHRAGTADCSESVCKSVWAMALSSFFYRETGYLSLSAAGVPLLIRELTAVRHQSASVAAAVVLGLQSTLHTDGPLRRWAARGRQVGRPIQ